MNQSRITMLNILGMVGMAMVLLMGLIAQVTLNELPCPLCLLQRAGFALVMFGFMLNVVYGIKQRHYGVVLLGAIFGAAAALRQVSLHVIPGTPPYGSAILGYHYYTWSFILFSATILAVAILLLLRNEGEGEFRHWFGVAGKVACWFAMMVMALNVISTFIECGPFQCPDNPVSYWLLSII
ncbi:disulfide bond formation protein B [Halomonas cupida]|uniref:disulfide bond formation protein B n=1 Tax=Halomonas cupida TaxID=44933 RepID=UPI003A926C7B